MLCFSCVKSGHAATRCPNLNDSFPFMQTGWQTEKTPGGFIMIPPRVAMDRRRPKTAADPRGEGGRLSGQGSCSARDPGGGAVSTVSPQPMTIDDVFQTVEQSGGGPLLVPSGVSSVWTEETMAGDISRRECPHEDIGIRPRMGTIWTSADRVPTTNIESPYGRGVSFLPGATGSLLPVKFPAAPVLHTDGPHLGSWQVAVVRVDKTPAGDAPGWKCPRAEQNRQRPIDVSEVTGNVRPVLPAGALPWLMW